MTGRRCLNCAASMPEHMRSDAQHCCRACLRATYRKRLLETPPVIGVEVEDAHDEVIGFLNELGKAMADEERCPQYPVYRYGDGWLIDFPDDPYEDGDSRRVYVERNADDWTITDRGEAAELYPESEAS